MQFLFQPFLWALAALAVPVIIHLFYFRRFKKVYFTNVRFLKEVKDETNSVRKLKNLLVLMSRLFALAFLVLAFAQPFIPARGNVQRGQKAVSVFVDNSLSMQALSKDAALLDLAKIRAKEIIEAYAPEDKFQVLTNDFEGRHQRLVNRDDALRLVEEIKIGPTTRTLDQVMKRQEQVFATGTADHNISYLISDFQANLIGQETFRDTSMDVNLLPLAAIQERNLVVDSVWFENPVKILNQPANLLVRVRNYGETAAEDVRLSLRYGGQTKPVGDMVVPPNGTQTDTVSFAITQSGWQDGMVSVADYPVQFDDDYYFSFGVSSSVNVLQIHAGTPSLALKTAFAGAPYFRLDNAESKAVNYAALPEYQLIVLNGLPALSSGLAAELQNFIKNGGNTLVFLPENADLNSYTPFLQNIGAGNIGAFDRTKRQVSEVNTEEFVFQDVFLTKAQNLRLPSTEGNFKIAAGRGEKLLSYRDGSAFVAKFPSGDGACYLCATPLDPKWSDLSRNGEIFVPMVFRMALAGGKAQKIAHTIGQDNVLEAKHTVAGAGETVYRLKGFASDKTVDNSLEEFIPEQRVLGSKVMLSPKHEIQSAGWYRILLDRDSIREHFAFNYDRRESDLSYTDFDKLSLPPNVKLLTSDEETNFTNYVGERNAGITLWRWCLIFTLIFLALEALLLRFWKA